VKRTFASSRAGSKPQTAAVERRKAGIPIAKGCAAPKRGFWLDASRRSAPLDLREEGNIKPRRSIGLARAMMFARSSACSLD
jgi:hypothetical protein